MAKKIELASDAGEALRDIRGAAARLITKYRQPGKRVASLRDAYHAADAEARSYWQSRETELSNDWQCIADALHHAVYAR